MAEPTDDDVNVLMFMYNALMSCTNQEMIDALVERHQADLERVCSRCLDHETPSLGFGAVGPDALPYLLYRCATCHCPAIATHDTCLCTKCNHGYNNGLAIMKSKI
jgi:hypothetical protein